MHERYLYPLFPYLTVLVAEGSIGLFMYILLSVISLLNLYNFWWVPEIGFVKSFLSFGERIMPRILGIVNFAAFLILYKKVIRSYK